MLGQNVTCDPGVGLICNNKDQERPPICYNYEIRVSCCTICHSTTPPTTTPVTTTPPTNTPTITPSTTTETTTSPTTTPTTTPSTTTTITTTPPTSTPTITPSTTTETTTSPTSTPTITPSTTTTTETTTSPTSTPTITPSTTNTEKTTSSPTSTPTITPSTTTTETTTSPTSTPTITPSTTNTEKTTSSPTSTPTITPSTTTETTTSPTSTPTITPSTTATETTTSPTSTPTITPSTTTTENTTSSPTSTPTITPSTSTETTTPPTSTPTITPSTTTTETTTSPKSTHITTPSTTSTVTTTPPTTTPTITPSTTTTETTTSPTSTNTPSTTTTETTTSPTSTPITPSTNTTITTTLPESTSTVTPSTTTTVTTIPPASTSTITPSTTPITTTTSPSTPMTVPTLSPITTKSPTSTTNPTSTSTPPPPKDCPYVDPPRKNGESWKPNNCSTDTCVNGTIIKTFVACGNVDVPVCENGYPPVKVYDESGCCFQYECECICSGWGDPHYVTFDGLYYSFQENCTYVLVKEIVPRYNFRIEIDNYNCDPSRHVTCPRSLFVYYKSYTIVLTPINTETTTSLVTINGKQIFPTYSNEDLMITSTGVQLLLKIPAIKAEVMFRSIQFSVSLPYSLFHNNTEGQCGTCDNNRKNDCRSPNGQIAPCPDTAHRWQIPDANKTYCKPGPPPPPPPTTPPCQPDRTKICDIIMSQVFKSCHDVIPPGPFFEACKYDVCHMTNKTIGCSSLEAYAQTCVEHSVCIDWRGSTNGLCGYKCPKPKVYKACGPAIQPTCNSRYNEKYIQPCEGVPSEKNFVCDEVREGCFCPEGTILFNTYSGTCVKNCGCTGPDGTNKQPGETWRSNCLECECSADTMSVHCRPVVCPTQQVVTCKEVGEVLVKETVDCCQQNKCVCDVSGCPEPPLCPLGTELNTSKGSCCLTYTCVPKPVCVFNNKEYQPGDVWSSPSNSCVQYNCTNIKDKFIPVDSKIQCPDFRPEDCIPGTETTDANGCCVSCTPSNCAVKKNTTYLQVNNCRSVIPVELAACGGACGTSSMYSAVKMGLMHSCSCCQELSTSVRQVDMVCSNGKKTSQSYTYINKCGCSVTECDDKH
uniref:Mucin 2, oligomeric mucus/gel-forming n=2 Tax=Esox lucius TaxID=8010 RepID=A0A6Q2YDU6_ESOLU